MLPFFLIFLVMLISDLRDFKKMNKKERIIYSIFSTGTLAGAVFYTVFAKSPSFAYMILNWFHIRG